MEWYWSSLIVLFFVGTFILYITNADMKLVEKVYNMLIKHHDKKHQKEEI